MIRKLEFDCIIYDTYKDLLKKSVYEPIILKLMNKSEIVFPKKYTYIVEQAHNESDFLSDDGEHFDSKILFYKTQCQALAVNKDNLYTFMVDLQKEINEIYEAIQNDDRDRVVNSIFYHEMIARINKANIGENIILFLPFSCTLEVSDNLDSLLKEDIFTYIFRYIMTEHAELLKEKACHIYIVYPNAENYIILKDLNTDEMEFVMTNLFSKYIKFVIKK